MSAWNRSGLGPWGRACGVWRREWEQSSVATRLRLHRCLQCARLLQAVRRCSAREGSPGNRTMKDRPGNRREWRWRFEWYSNYEWSLQEALLRWSFVFAVQEWRALPSALSWLHFVMFLSSPFFSRSNMFLSFPWEVLFQHECLFSAENAGNIWVTSPTFYEFAPWQE